MKGWLAGATLAAVAVPLAYFWAQASHSPVSSMAGTMCMADGHADSLAEMVWVPGGQFTMGAAYAYAEEGPSHQTQVAGFWMDRTEVTNAQFAAFVDATAYVTLAERGISNPGAPEAPAIPGSAVFKPIFNAQGELDPFSGWWQFVEGANWRHPEGPGTTIAGLERHPVVHVALEDAQAYAVWKGHSLPSEAQFEHAAQGSGRKNAAGDYVSNTWQGFFPFQNDPLDGHTGTAPVGCYVANDLGLHDLIGNVWEWTASPYYPRHDFARSSDYPEGYDPTQPAEPVAVIKGGSFLCAANYCMRYRPEARQGQSHGLGTSHIGFRTVRLQ